MRIHTLTWHPLRANPLNHVGVKDLVTPDGRRVKIEKAMGKGNFFVTIGNGERVCTGGNISTCAYLNRHEVGKQTH